MSPSTITFSDRTATVISVESLAEFPDILNNAAIPRSRPTLVVIGGASRLNPEDSDRVRLLFTQALAPIAQRYQAVVVDGGTDTGVMRLMGQARAELQATFPLVGVSPIGLVTLPGQISTLEDAAPLEPNHTHFFLVPGARWGDESIWLAQVASAIAADAPSITVLINGGDVTWEDAAQNVNMGRSLIVISGSGRTADILAAAVHGDVSDDRAKKLIQSGLVRSIDLADGSAALAQIIEAAFMIKK
jgi:hypothetical protein